MAETPYRAAHSLSPTLVYKTSETAKNLLVGPERWVDQTWYLIANAILAVALAAALVVKWAANYKDPTSILKNFARNPKKIWHMGLVVA